jgi:3',5'-cyclic AMP phosphodiesterase CpdA
MRGLHERTESFMPDFVLWNGDQTDHLDDINELAEHYLAPAKLPIAAKYPLAYVRGNHDMWGPEAHLLPKFTGTPNDRFYYAFRSGPLAAIVLDTGDGSTDEKPHPLGIINCSRMFERQAKWLEKVIEERWFSEAPFRVLFCHIPLYWHRNHRGEYSLEARTAWESLLKKAGIKVVISGHTHEPGWSPASETQPISQLVGGGPWTNRATIIHGTATREALNLKMSRLDGTVLHDVTLKV